MAVAEAVLRLDASQVVQAGAQAEAALGGVVRAGQQAQASTRAVAAGYGQLGQQLADVGVQLASGASPGMVAIQQGPQIASALGMMGTAGVALGGTMAALAVTSGALYVAWRAQHEEEERGVAISRAVTDAYRDMAGVLDDTRAKQIALAAATGQITEAEAVHATVGVRAMAAYRRANEDTIRRVRELRIEEGSLLTQAADFLVSGGLFGDFTGGAVSAAWDALTTDSSELRQEADALMAQLGRNAEITANNVDVTNDLADKTTLAARAAREHAAGVRAQQEALADLLRSMDEAPRIMAALAQAELALSFSRGEIDAQQFGERSAALNAAAFDAVGAQAAAAEAARQAAAGDAFRELQAALTAQTFATTDNTVAVRAATGDGVSRAAGVVGAVAGGPQAVMGAVASAGPWGALIAAIVDLVMNLEDVAGQFHDFHMRFHEAVGRLPQTIAEILPKALVEGTKAALDAIPDFLASFADYFDDILMGLAEALPEMIGEFVEVLIVRMPEVTAAFLVALVDPRTWIRAAIAFVEGIGTALAGVGDSGGAVGTSAHTGPGGTPVNMLVDDLFFGGSSKSTGSAASKSRTRGGVTYNITYAAPVMGVGPDTSTRLADEISRSTALRRPA